MDPTFRLRTLEEAGLVHPRADDVATPLFTGSLSFFLPDDKVQVKYEMLRAHILDGFTVSEAARVHGYSRAAYYLILHAFEQQGMLGLLDEQRGRRGPLKLTPEIQAYITAADPSRSGAELAREIERCFGVNLHRRTVEKARRG